MDWGQRNTGRGPVKRVVVALLAGSLFAASGVATLDDLRIGQAALEDGLYPVAEKAFRAHLADVRGAPGQREEALVWLVRTLYERKKYGDMLELLTGKSAWGRRPEGDAFCYWRAVALHAQANTPRALEEIEALFERYPASPYGAQAERLRSACHAGAGDLDKALASYARFEEKFATSRERPQNLLDWGMTLQSLGREGEAMVVLDRLVNVAPDTRVGRMARLLVGESNVRREKWDRAAAAFNALTQDKEAGGDLLARAWFGLASVHYSGGATNEAVTALSNGLTRAVAPVLRRKGKGRLGRLYFEIGQVDAGRGLMHEVIREVPTDRDAEKTQLDLAEALLRSGRAEAAVGEFQRYLEVYTNRVGQAAACEGKGWGLLESGRPAEAAGSFLSAYERYGVPERKARCLFKVADAYFANAQYTLAGETYRRFQVEFPSSEQAGQAAYQRGESLVYSDKLVEAEQQFLALMAQSAGAELTELAMLRIAELQRRQKRWADAIRAYEGMMKEFPEGRRLAAGLHGRGLAYYQRFRFAEALADFDRVVNEFPESTAAEQAFYMRAMSYYGLARDDQALATCKAFITRYPDSHWTREVVFWIGKYEYNRGNHEVAEDTFLRFAEKYADDAAADDALLWAGFAASKRKEYVRAIELLARLARQHPESEKIWEARFAQADAFSELARFSEAIVVFDEIINKGPDGPLVLRSWGRKGDCQFMLGGDSQTRYEEALTSYRVVANRSDASIDLQLQAEYKIGRCLEKMERVQEAFEQYYRRVILRYLEGREKGSRHNESARIWFTRAAFNAADILEARKEWRQEIRVLERVIEAEVPAANEARERVRKIQLARWKLLR